jgi:hypothetical protein
VGRVGRGRGGGAGGRLQCMGNAIAEARLPGRGSQMGGRVRRVWVGYAVAEARNHDPRHGHVGGRHGGEDAVRSARLAAPIAARRRARSAWSWGEPAVRRPRASASWPRRGGAMARLRVVESEEKSTAKTASSPAASESRGQSC